MADRFAVVVLASAVPVSLGVGSTVPAAVVLAAIVEAHPILVAPVSFVPVSAGWAFVGIGSAGLALMMCLVSGLVTGMFERGWMQVMGLGLS